MTNSDRVVDYILGNVGKLKPEKIKALATVIESLSEKPIENSPNKIKEEEAYQEIDQNNPMMLKDIKGFSFDGDETVYPFRPKE